MGSGAWADRVETGNSRCGSFQDSGERRFGGMNPRNLRLVFVKLHSRVQSSSSKFKAQLVAGHELVGGKSPQTPRDPEKAAVFKGQWQSNREGCRCHRRTLKV